MIAGHTIRSVQVPIDTAQGIRDRMKAVVKGECGDFSCYDTPDEQRGFEFHIGDSACGFAYKSSPTQPLEFYSLEGNEFRGKLSLGRDKAEPRTFEDFVARIAELESLALTNGVVKR